MERFFEADFSSVRVHEGPVAHTMGALAFTLGEELHFTPGLYDPRTREGVELLGHELTHVVQQREGRVTNPYGRGAAIVQDPALEAEADRMGQRIADQLWPASRVGQPTLQRKPRAPAAELRAHQEQAQLRDVLTVMTAGPHPTDPPRQRRPSRAAQATFEDQGKFDFFSDDEIPKFEPKKLEISQVPIREIDKHLESMKGLVVNSPYKGAFSSYFSNRVDVVKNPPKTVENVPHALAEMGRWMLYLATTTKEDRTKDSEWVYEQFPFVEVGYDYVKEKIKWYNPLTWVEPIKKTVKYGREFELEDVSKTYETTEEIGVSQSKKMLASLFLGTVVSQSLRKLPAKISSISSRPWLVRSFKGLSVFNMVLTVGIFLKQAEGIGRKLKDLDDSGSKGSKEMARLIRFRRNERIDPFLAQVVLYMEAYNEFEKEYGYLIDSL